ncbi:hypothetical protein AXF17_08550 [Mogibacterium pumilum]|uniref:Uncharacterized protein n=1 Tax=Mogibacterium pumilum TaxID=86332 RepID=A0A223ATX7_9FIRM|nr:hypothetical protein AXF17_08550 [Mogibacterium pumilum]
MISELHELVNQADDIKEEQQRGNHQAVQSFELYFSSIDDWRNFEENGGIRNLNEKIGETTDLLYKVLLPMAGILTEIGREDNSLPPEIVPYIGSITKGREEQILQDNYKAVAKLALARGIYVAHLGWLAKMVEIGAEVVADPGLNAYNHMSISVLNGLGAKAVNWSLELASNSDGNYPLMQTEHRFPMARLKGKREHDVRIVNNEFSSQSVVLPCGDDSNLSERVLKCLREGRFRLYV